MYWIFTKFYDFMRYYILYQPYDYEDNIVPWNLYSTYYYVNYYDESIELMEMDHFS